MSRLSITQTPQLPPVTLAYLQYGAAEGNRNAAAVAAAVQFRDARKAIEEACIEIVPRGMADGLSEHEVRNAIKSAYSRPPREPIGTGLRIVVIAAIAIHKAAAQSCLCKTARWRH